MACRIFESFVIISRYAKTDESGLTCEELREFLAVEQKVSVCAKLEKLRKQLHLITNTNNSLFPDFLMKLL